MDETEEPDPGPAETPIEKKVDEDWKRTAQLEKERFLRRDDPRGAPASERDADKATLLTLISSLYQQFLLSLGAGVPGGRADLGQARFTVELLVILRQKTKGNLTPDESSALDEILADCQMRFSEAARRP
jgi:hypothetical protein